MSRKNSAPKVKKIHLQSTRKRSMALTMVRVARYGLRNFARNAWLTVAATVVMVITLLIMFATGVVSSVLNETIKIQKSKIDISIYIKSDVSKRELVQLSDKLRKQPNVTEVSYSTSDQEYSKASVQNTEAFQIIAEEETHPNFPAVIHVKLDNMEKKSDLEKFVANDSQFKKAVDPEQSDATETAEREKTINRLTQLVTQASRIGVIVAIVFTIISILIIFNTIRMTIFSRREEISMMKSIGADSFFIRGPFLVEAQMYGILSAIIAFMIGYFAQSGILGGNVQVGHINSQVEGVAVTASIIGTWWPLILVAMIVVGVAIGDLSARLALRRYLKRTRY